MFSCSNEERNRLPSITPSHIDLSPEHPEVYFQIACGDYNMYGFIIVGQEEYRITKEIMSKEVTVVELSDGSKATFHCRNRILVKIDFGFMTISKIQRGKYKVQLNKNIYNPQIQISAESETKRSIFREKDKTKRSKKESAQHSKSRNKSFVMTSVSAL